MKLDLSTITQAVFGFFAVLGGLILLILNNKKHIPFLNSRKKELEALRNHFLFFEIQSWQDYQIDYKCASVPCSVRSALARKFLHIRFELKETYYKNLIDCLENEKKLTFQTIAEQKVQMEEEFTKRAIAEGIPEIVLRKFKQHISQSEIADLYLYERILQYKNFRTDEAKLSAMFCIDLKDLYVASKDVEDVIMGLNGEIDRALGLQNRRITDNKNPV